MRNWIFKGKASKKKISYLSIAKIDKDQTAKLSTNLKFFTKHNTKAILVGVASEFSNSSLVHADLMADQLNVKAKEL